MNIDLYKSIEDIVNKGNEEVLKAFNATGVTEIPSALKSEGFKVDLNNAEGFKVDLNKELSINQQIEVTQKVYQYLITKLAPLFMNRRHILLSNGFSVNIQDGQLIANYSFNDVFRTSENPLDVLNNMMGIKTGHFYHDEMNEAVRFYNILSDAGKLEDEEEFLEDLEKSVQNSVKEYLENIEYLKFMSEINGDFQQTLDSVEVFAKEVIENMK